MDAEVGWFGGKTPGSFYRINFCLGEITFPQMPIFVPTDELEASYSLILSATMLHGLVYTLDTRNDFLNVQLENACDSVRNLKVTTKDGNVVVLANAD